MSLFSISRKTKSDFRFYGGNFQRNSTFIPRTGAKVSTTTLSLRELLFTLTMSTGKKSRTLQSAYVSFSVLQNAHISCETNRNYIKTNFNLSYGLIRGLILFEDRPKQYLSTSAKRDCVTFNTRPRL